MIEAVNPEYQFAKSLASSIRRCLASTFFERSFKNNNKL
jgi:hypothetical protein